MENDNEKLGIAQSEENLTCYRELFEDCFKSCKRNFIG